MSTFVLVHGAWHGGWCWDRVAPLLRGAGLGAEPLPFDARGTDPSALAGESAVLLTPAHQFPMGVPLHRDRRAMVVDWARRTGGLVLEDDYASGRHARLFPQGSRWFIEDLGSTNGTYLGDQQLTRALPVEPGVPVRIGKTVIELRP